VEQEFLLLLHYGKTSTALRYSIRTSKNCLCGNDAVGNIS